MNLSDRLCMSLSRRIARRFIGKEKAPEAKAEYPIEEAYFHGSNGGLTLRIVESKTLSEIDKHPKGENGFPDFDAPVTGKDINLSMYWRLEAELSHFGSTVKVEVPLPHPRVIGWLVGALVRTSARMGVYAGTKPSYGWGVPFEDTKANVKVRDGEEVPEEPVKMVSESGSDSV